MADGGITVGPNAVLGMAREGYGSGGDGFSALAAGGVGLGIGLLLSNRGRRDRNV